MNPEQQQSNLSYHIESYVSRYKELIITTIICLFLTGIYDSINNQIAEIKKWYELMINIRAEQRIQSIDLDAIKTSMDEHQSIIDVTLDDHDRRLRALERDLPPNQPFNPLTQ